MTLSTKQAERYDPLFEMYDTNNDGFVSGQDYDLMAQRVLKAFNQSTSSPQAQQLNNEYAQAWEIISYADSDGDGRVSRDEFRHAMADYTGKHHLFEETSRAIMAAEFAVADNDGDGIIDQDQFTTLAKAFGYDPQAANAAFSHLDRDSDGRISQEEYFQAWDHYASSPTPNGPDGSIFGQSQ